MEKQEIKDKLLDAIRHDPHRKDIKSAAIFGSYVNGTPSEESDIDVLVDFMPAAKIGYFELFDIQQNMKKSVGKKIDLLTPQAISKYFRDQVLQQAEYFYEG